jgi:hypothetical protein
LVGVRRTAPELSCTCLFSLLLLLGSEQIARTIEIRGTSLVRQRTAQRVLLAERFEATKTSAADHEFLNEHCHLVAGGGSAQNNEIFHLISLPFKQVAGAYGARLENWPARSIWLGAADRTQLKKCVTSPTSHNEFEYGGG